MQKLLAGLEPRLLLPLCANSVYVKLNCVVYWIVKMWHMLRTFLLKFYTGC
jgi:hypothetical protein